MATFIRPSAVQFARFASPLLRSASRQTLRANRLPKQLALPRPNQLLRCYATQPPKKSGKDESQPEDGASSGKKDTLPDKEAEESRLDAKASSEPTLAPLPDGWVRLSEEEIAQLSRLRQMLPETRKSGWDEVLLEIRKVGAPQELRDLLAKSRDKGLGIGDAMRAIGIAGKLANRMAALQAEEETNNLFNANRPGDNASQDQPKDGQQGAQPGEQQGEQKSQDGQANDAQGSAQGGQGKTPPPPPPRGPELSDTIAWVVTAALLYPVYKMIFPGEAQREITWQELRKNFLEKGLVEKLTVFKNRVRVDLNREATQSVYPDMATSNPYFHYYFSIGSVESFENKLEEAQNDLKIPASERIPVSYATEGVWTNMILAFGPTLLLVGLLYWFSRRAGGGAGGSSGVFGFGKSRAKMFNHESAVKVKFSDVAGMDEAKTEIMEFVSFLKSPERFQRLGAKIPRGAILSGPPGTGKTLLAKATAGESQVPFFSVSGSEFVEMFVGVGASRVRDLFATARKNAPCIIFIDEIDAIGKARGEGARFGGNDEREATLNQILTEMDGFNTSEQVVVLAGTNRPDILDKALMRPGRFDRHINIDRPTMKGRQDIFRVHLSKIVTNEDMDYLTGRLAALTPGFAGADIANCVNEAALIAARANAQTVEMTHFEQAIERVIGGLERKSLVLSPEEKKTVAYHEAGHAICGWYFQWADPLLKVSIIPRGQGALGYAQYLPTGDAYLMNTNQLMDRMAMTLGGRVSEELHFPTVTTGASDDFKKVTRMATTMVTQWGMSEKLGPLHFVQDQNQFNKPFAESTAQTIDAEVRRIVDQAYKQCKDLLTAKKTEIGLVAEELLRKEMLTRDDMVRLLGPRPFPDKEEFSKFFNNDGGKSAPPPFPTENTDSPPAGPEPAVYGEIRESDRR